jgi:hypothetical protein
LNSRDPIRTREFDGRHRSLRPREAGRLGGHGKTKTFELIKSGELESYLDGSVRMVVTASIRARVNRKLKESGGTTKDTHLLTEASLQKRARQKAQAEGDATTKARQTEVPP